MRDRIEFYELGSGLLLVTLDSSVVPTIGAIVNIRKARWVVEAIGFTVDYADDINRTQMTTCVTLKPEQGQK